MSNRTTISTPLPLSVAALKARARDITGINIDDRDADEPLAVLCRSYNTDSALNDAGAKVICNYLVRILCNRLRMQRDFIKYPEIADQKISTPLFLWGMPRTGSTKAQKLLAASGDFNWLTFWQSHNPSLIDGDRAESPDLRIRDADEFTEWFRTASPDTRHTHPLRTHEPEEETFILMHSLRSPCFMAFANMAGYLQWLATQDMTAQFAYLKNTLKYLQWQGLATGSKSWVLKSPVSFGMEQAVLGVFPDARLAMTHRQLKETIPSFCSTIDSYFSPFSDAPINHAIGIGQLIWALNLHIASRRSMPGTAILDIDYRDLVQSPESVIEKVYAHCGQPLTQTARNAMLEWNRKNSSDGHARHEYLLADFGLTEAAVNTQFADYLALLRNLFDDRLFY